MKICFLSSRMAVVKSENLILIDQSNGRLLEELLKLCPSMDLAIIATPNETTFYDHKVRFGRVIPLKIPFSYGGGLFHFFKIWSQLRILESQYDLLIIQLPFVGFLSLLLIRKPTIYHVCANVITAAGNPTKYYGVHGFFAGVFARVMDKTYRILFSRTKVRVITTGGELFQLYNEFKPVKVISSSVWDSEIIKPDVIEFQKANLKPISIVFVGRPSLEKGFDTLVMALLKLQFPFQFTIVGFSEPDFAALLPEAYQLSRSIRPNMVFMNHVGWDRGLREILLQAHVGVVPSRSEGTPRVIIEYHSQGVAVVASKVGGIPDVIDNGKNGLLAETGNVEELAKQISLVSMDEELRNKLVLEGLNVAHRYTVSNFAQQFKVAIDQLTNE